MPVEILPLPKDAPDDIYNTLSVLFKEMYDYMSEKGLHLSLVEEGETSWVKSIRNSLGKLNIVLLAKENDEIIGFSAGNLRIGPAYLGSKKAGYISHVYVRPNWRKNNAGRILAVGLEEWFRKKNVDYIELEVIVQNEGAKAFWSSLGYGIDNIRMIKT